MRYAKRRGPPMKLIGILVVVLAVAGVASVFWFSSQADSKAPPQEEIRVEATNVGPH